MERVIARAPRSTSRVKEIPSGPIRLAVVAAASEYGREAFRGLSQWAPVVFTIAVDNREVGKSMRALAGGRAADVMIEDKLGAALDREPCDVLLDFSHSSAALQHGISALRRKCVPILNAPLSAPEIRELHAESKETEVPALVVPHLSIGVVLALELCERAARWMPDFEVVDVQEESKHDGPSGMATALAQALSDGWEQKHALASGAAGEYGKSKTWEDVPMHVMHLRGARPSHEVFFGTPGESFYLGIVTRDAGAILDGLKLAISSVRDLKGVTVGLDKLL